MTWTHLVLQWNDSLSSLTMVVTSIGMTLSFWHVADAWGNLKVAYLANGCRVLMAKVALRNACSRGAAQGLLLLMGLLTLTLPEVPLTMPQDVLTVLAERKLLRLLLSLLLMISVLLDRRDHERLVRCLEQRQGDCS